MYSLKPKLEFCHNFRLHITLITLDETVTVMQLSKICRAIDKTKIKPNHFDIKKLDGVQFYNFIIVISSNISQALCFVSYYLLKLYFQKKLWFLWNLVVPLIAFLLMHNVTQKTFLRWFNCRYYLIGKSIDYIIAATTERTDFSVNTVKPPLKVYTGCLFCSECL